MEPAKHLCVRMHRQVRENLKSMSELSDIRVRGEAQAGEKTRGPETIKPGNGRAGGGAGRRSAQVAGTYVVCTVSGNTAQLGVRRTIFSNAICTNAISAIGSNTVCTNAIGTVSSNAVCTDAVSTIGSNAVCTNAVGTVSSNAICTNAVSAVSSNTIDVGVGRAVFSNDWRVYKWAGINSREGESAGCQYREGQAKNQCVGFHGSCSSTFDEWVTRYGADVTRRKINQNSIRVVANIVGVDS